VLLLCVGAYGNALRNGFVRDDQILIVENETIRSLDALIPNLTSEFFYFERSPLLAEKRGYYRPLVTVSYLVGYAWWNLNPTGYHATNLSLHILATVLVYVVLRSLPMGRTSAWLAGALFATHPVHTESVSRIAGRTDVLASVFFLAALYGYLRALGAGAAPARTRRDGRGSQHPPQPLHWGCSPRRSR